MIDWLARTGLAQPQMAAHGRASQASSSPQSTCPVSPDAAAPLDALHKASWALGSLTANGSNVRVANDGHGVQVFWQDPSFKPYISLVVQAGRAVESSLNLRPGHKTVTVQAVPASFTSTPTAKHLLGGGLALGQQQHQRAASFLSRRTLVSVVGQSQLPSCPPGGCIVVTAVLRRPTCQPARQLDLQQLLPANTTYMAYGGSLTTPPCSEGVTWLVLLNSQALSVRQAV
ncbi:hypothetical protein COO60DRAFT_1645359 [Scenedesmus sp. NREL 46B-D3]|nr:hypothetical protein COO60DRAFT_1645359 [Scenedesmus sp. NREL 46B-D3]